MESFRDTIHQYENASPRDPFTSRISTIKKTSSTLPKLSEKQFLSILLRRLNIPVESQILVFSTTSLQLSKISPRNPKGHLFFQRCLCWLRTRWNARNYWYRPELGAIPTYSPSPPPTNQKLKSFDPENVCVATHHQILRCLGLLLRSVVPGSGCGGSLDSMERFPITDIPCRCQIASEVGAITNAKPFHSSLY